MWKSKFTKITKNQKNINDNDVTLSKIPKFQKFFKDIYLYKFQLHVSSGYIILINEY